MRANSLSFLIGGVFLLAVSAASQAANVFDCLIEPMQTVEVRSPVIGLLDSVHVRRGDKIEKGQVLATLESTAERASTELARFKSEMTGPLKTAQNKVEFAKRKFERRRDLSAKNFVSEQDRDDAEAEMKLAEAEFQLAQENKQLALLEWQQQSGLLNLRTIHSPFDGVVVDQMLYAGEVVEPSDQKKPIFKLAQLDPLRVHVILPMRVFGKIKLGMKAIVKPEVPVGARHEARVQIVDRVIDAASGTLGVFLEISNPKLNIPAGVKCQVEFPVAVDAPKAKKIGGVKKSAAH